MKGRRKDFAAEIAAEKRSSLHWFRKRLSELQAQKAEREAEDLGETDECRRERLAVIEMIAEDEAELDAYARDGCFHWYC
jgi:hypothetical protein